MDLKLRLFVFITTMLIPGCILAQYGGLDYSFGGTGAIIHSFDMASDGATCMAVQPDGKILVGGTTEQGGCFFLLTRYLNSGKIDSTFGGGIGSVKTQFSSSYDASAICSSMALQPDGKIILAGAYLYNSVTHSSYALARYNADGSLDTTFDHDGLVTTYFSESIFSQINAIALQSDGKILATGFTGNRCKELSRISVARYNSNGILDSTFGLGGRVLPLSQSSNAHAIQVNADGKIVIVGSTDNSITSWGTVLRLNTDGSLDSSFNSSRSGNYFMAMALQPDGKIVAAGLKAEDGTGHAFLIRFNEDGTKDPGFDSSLTVKQFDDIFYDIAITPDGKIIAVGSSGTGTASSFLIVRFNPDGSYDHSFGSEGVVLSSFYENNIAFTCAIDGDGKILAAGYAALPHSYTDFILARYYNNAVSVNGNQALEPLMIYPNPASNSIYISLPYLQEASFRLMDINGHILKEEIFSSQEYKVDISNYNSEVFLLEIVFDNNRYIRRVFKN